MQDVKINALLQTAKAYVDRGAYIQYDQRCMDRSVFFTPRRVKILPPESATQQHTLYLDCSGFINAVYYEAFGYELPSDLTWHMIDLVEPRVYFYVLTHNETEEEKKEIGKTVCDLLLPGDIITLDRYKGSGHTMLYVGDGKYYHCSSCGRPDSYDYINRKSREYPDGGLFECEVAELFESKLFKENVRRFCVSRPLERVGAPTERAMKRLSETSGLWCEVTTSHPGVKTISKGEIAKYILTVKNSYAGRNVSVEFDNGEMRTEENRKIKSGGEEIFEFSVKPEFCEEVSIKTPLIKVNGMDVFVPRILTGNKMDEKVTESITKKVRDKLSCGASAYEAAITAYEKAVTKTENECMRGFFHLHDNQAGDVLSRRKQNPYTDMAVYSFFGGTGVATPEIMEDPFVRIRQIRKEDFMQGDILLCSNDALFEEVTSYYYTGEEFLSTENISDTDSFTDGLLGKFCFILLRPSYKEK